MVDAEGLTLKNPKRLRVVSISEKEIGAVTTNNQTFSKKS
jgi:hypothetical protein